MPFLILVVFSVIWLYALVESISSDETLIRNLPKMAWVILIVLAPPVGSIAWFIAGRPLGDRSPIVRDDPAPAKQIPAPRRPLGPEDSPQFATHIEERRRLQRWEQELARREEELRRREESG
jgi:hypothetical protein